MPSLDVSFVLTDPMIADTFDVKRRGSQVGEDGRVVPYERLIRNQKGVITQQDASVLMRAEDAQLVPKSIFIATRFQAMAGGTESHLPDLIIWDGGTYEVTSCLPYRKYGRGFYEVIAVIKTGINPVQ